MSETPRPGLVRFEDPNPLKVPFEAGDVVGVCEWNGRLVVACKRRVYSAFILADGSLTDFEPMRFKLDAD